MPKRLNDDQRRLVRELVPVALYDPVSGLYAGKGALRALGYDFTPIPNGATLPREAVGCDWLASDVERVNGVIEFTLILPHGAGASQAALFPKQINSTANGAVRLPE